MERENVFKESADSPTRPSHKPVFSEMGSSDIRTWCFGDELNCAWRRPGQSLVSRKICLLIRKRVYPTSSLVPEDLFQEVYSQIWRDFDKVEKGFRESGRPQTWINFEKWLHTSLDHYLIDAIRRSVRQENRDSLAGGSSRENLEEYIPDPVQERRMIEYTQQALATLTQTERDLLVGRLVNEQSVDDLATPFGETKKAVYHRLYKAKLKFRNEMIRLLAVDHLTRYPLIEAQLRLVIMSRCEIGKPCYMYRVNCPKARSAEMLTSGEMKNMAALEIAKRLELLKTTIERVLDDWDLGRTLDRCFWAVQ